MGPDQLYIFPLTIGDGARAWFLDSDGEAGCGWCPVLPPTAHPSRHNWLDAGDGGRRRDLGHLCLRELKCVSKTAGGVSNSPSAAPVSSALAAGAYQIELPRARVAEPGCDECRRLSARPA